MTNPSPDLIRQVEAESVDSRELKRLLDKYAGEAGADISACVGRIITARVAAAIEQAASVIEPAFGSAASAMARRLAASQAAPAKAEGPKLAHGHRDDWYLMANARHLAEMPIRKAVRLPNWAFASELFATGSTSAHQICRDAGIDPDDFKVERSPSTPAKEPT